MAEKKQKARNIGLNVKAPDESCNDKNCPFHGSLPVRGQILTGIVSSTKMQKAVQVKKEYMHYIPKYEIYGITNQLRRAVVSINLNIAEGNGRSNKREQKQFYNIAKASLYECIAILDICVDREYMTKNEYLKLEKIAEKILARLNGLIKYVRDRC